MLPKLYALMLNTKNGNNLRKDICTYSKICESFARVTQNKLIMSKQGAEFQSHNHHKEVLLYVVSFQFGSAMLAKNAIILIFYLNLEFQFGYQKKMVVLQIGIAIIAV